MKYWTLLAAPLLFWGGWIASALTTRTGEFDRLVVRELVVVGNGDSERSGSSVTILPDEIAVRTEVKGLRLRTTISAIQFEIGNGSRNTVIRPGDVALTRVISVHPGTQLEYAAYSMRLQSGNSGPSIVLLDDDLSTRLVLGATDGVDAVSDASDERGPAALTFLDEKERVISRLPR